VRHDKPLTHSSNTWPKPLKKVLLTPQLTPVTFHFRVWQQLTLPYWSLRVSGARPACSSPPSVRPLYLCWGLSFFSVFFKYFQWVESGSDQGFTKLLLPWNNCYLTHLVHFFPFNNMLLLHTLSYSLTHQHFNIWTPFIKHLANTHTQNLFFAFFSSLHQYVMLRLHHMLRIQSAF